MIVYVFAAFGLAVLLGLAAFGALILYKLLTDGIFATRKTGMYVLPDGTVKTKEGYGAPVQPLQAKATVCSSCNGTGTLAEGVVGLMTGGYGPCPTCCPRVS